MAIAKYQSNDYSIGFLVSPKSLIKLILLPEFSQLFFCFLGIFHFLQLPFGLKSAPSYFQQNMAGLVLIGLMYIICEAYLDDVIFHGTSDPDIIKNLRKVLLRFKQYHIKLSSEMFGLGHTNSQGWIQTIHRSRYPFQRTYTSSFFYTLHKSMLGYTKRNRTDPLVMDDLSIAAFESVKTAIANAPLL